MSEHEAAARRMAAECLCFRVRRVSRVITRVYDDALRPLGLLGSQLTLLNAVTLMGRSATPGGLARVLATDTTTLSRNLAALERSGWIELGRLHEDRRVRVAALTPAGERLVAEALPLWERAHARLAELLGPGAAAELALRLDGAAAAAAAEGAAPDAEGGEGGARGSRPPRRRDGGPGAF